MASHDNLTPVIDLQDAPGARMAWEGPAWKVYAWAACEVLFITNPFQISSNLRVKVLRLFGAKVGKNVIFRPRTRVKFPWNLQVGDRSWIGEGVWIHNQDNISIGADVSISQETFLTTGSHAYRADMALITKPISIKDGAWITTRSIILGGSVIGISSMITPGTVIGPNANVPDNTIVGHGKPQVHGKRFEKEGTSA